MTANEYGVSFWGEKNVLKFDSGHTVCEYTRNHYIMHLKRVDFMVCELQLNEKNFKEYNVSMLADIKI